MYCENDVDSKHFSRHLQRKHKDEREVQEFLQIPKNHPMRKNCITLIRSAGNLEFGLKGYIIPKRRIQGEEADETSHALCSHCKGYFKKQYLHRHVKRYCVARTENSEGRANAIMESMVFTACQKKYGDILNKMTLKNEVLKKMRGDELAREVMEDILIISWGDDLLKKTPNARSKYHISAKMRRCANFIVAMRKLNSKYTDMLSCLKPEAFDDVIEATKIISKFDVQTRTFKAATTALQFGTYLKQIADLTMKIVLRRKVQIPVEDKDASLTDLKRFKHLIETQWATELGSLALKDLNNRASQKIQLLPLTEDVIKLKRFLDNAEDKAFQDLLQNKSNIEAYKTLVSATLVSSILHNRKRVGDIQYLEVESYAQQRRNNDFQINQEFLSSLSEGERILIKNYTKINTIGKGSRTVPVLIPKEKLKHYDMVYKIRTNKNLDWFPRENIYFFTFPKSSRWISGTASINKYSKLCGAKQPHLITSTRLRKHIATTTQLLALRKNEIDQLAKFMGHTTRTHEQFYK